MKKNLIWVVLIIAAIAIIGYFTFLKKSKANTIPAVNTADENAFKQILSTINGWPTYSNDSSYILGIAANYVKGINQDENGTVIAPLATVFQVNGMPSKSGSFLAAIDGLYYNTPGWIGSTQREAIYKIFDAYKGTELQKQF
jgi:hypothetical protein